MPLHLVKLCVGAESVADLEGWIGERLAALRAKGQPADHRHTTRMVPKRRDDLLDGGSLYWVIKGQIAARQSLNDVEAFTGSDGIGRCHLVLDPVVVGVEPRPRRPFQGWRYLPDHEAPPDLGRTAPELLVMPEPLRRELRDLGLI